MRNKGFLCLLFAIGALILSPPAYAGGLSTPYGEIVLEDVEMGFGRQTSMQEQYGSPLLVQNTSDRELDLRIEALYPREDELVAGYEPIPDISWITIEQQDFHAMPHSNISTDISISAPMDADLVGKKYQAYIWSHTVGMSVGAGLKSRLLIHIKE